MKLFGSVVGVLLLLTGVSSAGTPDSVNKLLDIEKGAYRLDDKTGQWKFNKGGEACEAQLAEVTKAGVADSLTVDVAFDTPDWKAGKHTVAELRTLCKRIMKADAIHRMVAFFDIGSTVGPDIALNCMYKYDEFVAAKQIDPNWTLPYEGISIKDPATGDPFAGTLAQGRVKFCDNFAKELLAEMAAAEAPYRKVLKGDKLDRALYEQGKMIYGKGKKELDTPEKLAKENLWFRETWYDDSPCGLGKKEYMVWRYEFDKNSMLKPGSGNSTKYCGAPPKSKFK